jgi:hypothetical protein
MTTKLRAASFQDSAVTNAKIAADAVTAAKIPANAIGSSELDLTADYAFSGTVSGDNNGYKLLSRQTWTSAVSVVSFADIIDSTITNIIVKGSVRYTNGQNSLTYMYLTTSGGSIAGTGGSGLAVYQGSWHNRAAAASLSSAARNGNFQYLRLPDNDNAYGGTVQTWTVEINDINAGRTQGTTNISGTPKHYGGTWAHQGQYVNASDWSGGGGWCKFINANNDLAAITGVRFNPSVSNYQTGEIAVYGLATS